MQGFYPPVHDLRKAGVIGDFGDRDPGLGHVSGGPAGGENLDPGFTQCRGEADEPGFIGNGDQRAGDPVGHNGQFAPELDLCRKARQHAVQAT